MTCANSSSKKQFPEVTSKPPATSGIILPRLERIRRQRGPQRPTSSDASSDCPEGAQRRVPLSRRPFSSESLASRQRTLSVALEKSCASIPARASIAASQVDVRPPPRWMSGPFLHGNILPPGGFGHIIAGMCYPPEVAKSLKEQVKSLSAYSDSLTSQLMKHMID